MGKGSFEVGDRVRSPAYPDFGIMTLTGYNFGTWDGDGDNGKMGAFDASDLEKVGEESELATLRAFKEQAIARYPDLAPSEPETDEHAAIRLGQEYWDDKHKEAHDLASAAIAWARANPR
jgi:hypothetical protein